MIKITINGKKQELADGTTIESMLKLLKYKNEWMGVAVNMQFVAKELHSQTLIKDGDEIEVLSPMSGG